MIDDEIADQPGLVMLGQVDYCSHYTLLGYFFFCFLVVNDRLFKM